jgi:hypothetical protein
MRRVAARFLSHKGHRGVDQRKASTTHSVYLSTTGDQAVPHLPGIRTLAPASIDRPLADTAAIPTSEAGLGE